MSTIAEAEKAVEFNVFYAKRNVVDSIWKEAIIEGVNITYPQAKVIVEYNQTVEGLTVTGTITVYNLKLAWNYLFEHLNSLVDFEFVAKINSIMNNKKYRHWFFQPMPVLSSLRFRSPKWYILFYFDAYFLSGKHYSKFQNILSAIFLHFYIISFLTNLG